MSKAAKKLALQSSPEFDSQLEMNTEPDEFGPEVKAFIYQTITEFQPFSTPETLVSVVSKNPMGLLKKLASEGTPIEAGALKKMHRIEISLKEGETVIKSEGLSTSIFDAISSAKNQLIVMLTDIQDQVISAQDRQAQISSARQNQGVH